MTDFEALPDGAVVTMEWRPHPPGLSAEERAARVRAGCHHNHFADLKLIAIHHQPTEETIMTEPKKKTTGRERALNKARLAVIARGAAYGSPEALFVRIAERWALTLDTHARPQDVALAMIDLKLERLVCAPYGSEPYLDSVVDIIGYAACLYELAEVGFSGRPDMNEDDEDEDEDEDFSEWENMKKW